MSNYPDGVSGNEYEISGPTYEETESKECDNQNCLYVPAGMVRGSVATAVQRLHVALEGGPLGRDAAEKLMRSALGDFNELVTALVGEEAEFACDWSGDVDVQGYQGQKWWTCPRCGIEHVEDVDDEPDPDRERF